MSAVLEVLRAGRERVARGWTQRAMARRSETIAVAPSHPNAVCWCAAGGIYADHRTKNSHEAAVTALERELPPGDWDGNIIAYNDLPTTTQADVLALFDRAIAALETA